MSEFEWWQCSWWWRWCWWWWRWWWWWWWWWWHRQPSPTAGSRALAGWSMVLLCQELGNHHYLHTSGIIIIIIEIMMVRLDRFVTQWPPEPNIVIILSKIKSRHKETTSTIIWFVLGICFQVLTDGPIQIHILPSYSFGLLWNQLKPRTYAWVEAWRDHIIRPCLPLPVLSYHGLVCM